MGGKIVISAFLVLLFSSSAIGETDLFLQRGELSINKVSSPSKEVGVFELFELTVDLFAAFDNPFDPEDIEVKGHFTAPSGKEVSVSGFYYQGYTRGYGIRQEELTEEGSPQWKIRFAGRETGEYKYYVTVRDRTGTAASGADTFRVVESKNPGFIHVLPGKSSMYPVFDTGKAYFAVGENVGWTLGRQTYDYDKYFGKLGENNCNFARVWMCPRSLGLEWTAQRQLKGDYYGPGKYSLKNSWRFDYIINEAREKGLYILLSLDTFEELMVEKFWRDETWKENPYNIVNGGPCKTPDELWSNKKARKQYENRLSYIIARWGYSTNLLGLEFWNEVNSDHDWLKEMSGFIKHTDPYGHCVTTSIGYPWGKPYDADKTWKLDGIDFTEPHVYETVEKDHVASLNGTISKMLQKYHKPCLSGEFGVWDASEKGAGYYDKDGIAVNLHNGLWAAPMSGSFGTAMYWWWDNYVEKKNLYSHFKAFFDFAKDIDWAKGDFSKAEITLPVKEIRKDEEIVYTDMVLSPSGAWGDAGSKEFILHNNGDVEGGAFNTYLHGTSKKKEGYRLIPIFHVDFKKPGKFIVSIDKVSMEGFLHVYVDGKDVWQKRFPTDPKTKAEGGWQTTEYQKQWKIYQAIYDKEYSIDVPAGKHTIKLENTGVDWIQIKMIRLTDYKDSSFPDVRILGIKREGEALLWIQNRESNAYNNFKNIEPKPITGMKFDLLKMKDGEYTIAWWDTRKGCITAVEKVNSNGGKMTINPPEVARDIACKIYRGEK